MRCYFNTPVCFRKPQMAEKKKKEGNPEYMKFNAPIAPIFLEKEDGPMEPLSGQALKMMIEILDKQIQEIAKEEPDNALRMAKIQAFGTKLVQLQTASLKSDVNREFAQEFVLWLQGKSKYNTDESKTPWKTLPLVGPSIREYIKTFATEKIKLNVQMTKLRVLPPQDIFQAWLYFKYIVREMTPNPEDYFLEQFNWWTSQPVPAPTGDPNSKLAPQNLVAPSGKMPAKPNPGYYDAGAFGTILGRSMAPAPPLVPTVREVKIEKDKLETEQDLNSGPDGSSEWTTTTTSAETRAQIERDRAAASLLKPVTDALKKTSDTLTSFFSADVPESEQERRKNFLGKYYDRLSKKRYNNNKRKKHPSPFLRQNKK